MSRSLYQYFNDFQVVLCNVALERVGIIFHKSPPESSTPALLASILNLVSKRSELSCCQSLPAWTRNLFIHGFDKPVSLCWKGLFIQI